MTKYRFTDRLRCAMCGITDSTGKVIHDKQMGLIVCRSAKKCSERQRRQA